MAFMTHLRKLAAWLNLPGADSTDNDTHAEVLGTKEDTAKTTADVSSAMNLLRAAIETFLTPILAREYEITKEVTCNTGVGAQVYDLFTLTGAVDIREMSAELTDATDVTTLNKVAIVMNDGTATIDLTESATGVNWSGKAVGIMAKRTAIKTSVLTNMDNAAGVAVDGALLPISVAKKTGATTTIRLSVTEDANTNAKIKVTLRYRPFRLGGGSLVAA